MIERSKIVIIDDEPRFVHSLEKLFERQYEISYTLDSTNAAELVMREHPHLVLLNLTMPKKDGYQVLKELKQREEISDTPVIVVTGLHETIDETKSLRMGAVDYITKPYNPDILKARIDTHIELKRQRDFFRLLSFQDYLTNIPNRRGFNEIIEREHKRCRRNRTVLSLLMIDVDFFKSYNDLYGHLAGDKCLQLIVETMAQQLRRPSDQLTRFGGEEFACVLPETDLKGATVIAESLHRSISDLHITHANGIDKQVSVSIGIASSHPDQGDEVETLLLEADQCLYKAKMAGRNRIYSLENRRHS